ncbi:EC1118_1E8_2729p [Saccharomyces cerevisiae EC1118]|uniref:EC1118_1E8_2729p n=1 Tax=Saccharomyces cerevisiae (strain Lalvin EC1118 / Prise de mousse) TaxID=643680 RepID=C8Z7F3_YEAS8|nr:EC1118_1E8_2729p [Saccharomyces cerevisiae EC1118]
MYHLPINVMTSSYAQMMLCELSAQSFKPFHSGNLDKVSKMVHSLGLLHKQTSLRISPLLCFYFHHQINKSFSILNRWYYKDLSNRLLNGQFYFFLPTEIHRTGWPTGLRHQHT